MANAVSGVRVSDDSKLKFMELKTKKTYRYIVYKINEEAQEIIVEKLGEPSESYDAFSSSLPDNDARFGIFDLDFVTAENIQKSKIFFILWSPGTSRVKAKMLYASSKESFRRALDGVHYEIQATDPSELDLAVIKERAQ